MRYLLEIILYYAMLFVPLILVGAFVQYMTKEKK